MCGIGAVESLKTPMYLTHRGNPFWKLMWLKLSPMDGAGWVARGIEKEPLAPALFKHQGSCFGLSFLTALSVGSAVRGHGFYHHQSVDDSQIICSLCSSSSQNSLDIFSVLLCLLCSQMCCYSHFV